MPRGKLGPITEIGSWSGCPGQIVSGGFSFSVSLEDTEAGLAIGPVIGQQAWLLGFLLSSRESVVT